MNFNAFLFGNHGKQFQVTLFIRIGVEEFVAVNTPRDNMMGSPDDNEPCYSCHDFLLRKCVLAAGILAELRTVPKKGLMGWGGEPVGVAVGFDDGDGGGTADDGAAEAVG